MWKHTISFAFKLLQSNNPISIQILNKFRNWRGGQEGFVVGALPLCPPLTTALVYQQTSNMCLFVRKFILITKSLSLANGA